jgi:hypothetical protein
MAGVARLVGGAVLAGVATTAVLWVAPSPVAGSLAVIGAPAAAHALGCGPATDGMRVRDTGGTEWECRHVPGEGWFWVQVA